MGFGCFVDATIFSMKKLQFLILLALIVTSCSSTILPNVIEPTEVVVEQNAVLNDDQEIVEVVEVETSEPCEDVLEEVPSVIDTTKESAFFIPTEEPIFDVVLIRDVEETVPIQEVEEIEELPVEVEEPAPEPIIEKKTVLQNMEDTLRGEGEPKEAIINGNVIPMWFTYTCSFILLAILFTLCYIAKQRKEAIRWSGRN